MSGNFDHLSNRELADLLAGYNLYGTTRSSGIPGPVLLKLIQSRLRKTEPLNDVVRKVTTDNNSTLTPLGERLIDKE